MLFHFKVMESFPKNLLYFTKILYNEMHHCDIELLEKFADLEANLLLLKLPFIDLYITLNFK